MQEENEEERQEVEKAIQMSSQVFGELGAVAAVALRHRCLLLLVACRAAHVVCRGSEIVRACVVIFGQGGRRFDNLVGDVVTPVVW